MALSATAGSLPGALLSFGIASILLSNVINNQPMTILMTRVCLAEAFTTRVAPARVQAALFVSGSHVLVLMQCNG